MNITVVGASAGLGLETVKRALQRKHRVTTLSRSAISLAADPMLNPIQGSALVKADLKKSLSEADAVVVTLGTRKGKKATTLFSDFAQLALELQKETDTQIPFVFVTGFGAGESKIYMNRIAKMLLNLLLKEVYEDKSRMEEIVANSQMNWIIVRPGRLMDKPLTEKYRIETELFKGINIGSINRTDLADYLVKLAENPTGLGKFHAISQK
jgi:putative NADH-flavin reductase